MLNHSELIKMSQSKLIHKIHNELKEAFDLTLNQIQWSFKEVPLEKEDLLNMFLINLPELVKKFDATRGVKLKTFLCLNLRLQTFNTARTFGTRKYKVMNHRIDLDETRYIIKVNPAITELDYSTLTKFEYSVFLSLFEANRTIEATAIEHKSTRYIIEKTLLEIKSKLKKQII